MAPLSTLMPKYYLYDPSRHILITELLDEGENLSEYHRRLNEFPVGVAEKLGRALGTYHRQTVSKLAEGPQKSVFAKQVPWILSINQQNGNLFQALSAANSQLFNIVRTYPEFDQALDELRSQWRVDSADAADLLESCVRYAAARMIQTAYEYMQYSSQISANALYLLQVSLNTLKDPKEAIRDLLAL